MSDPLVSIICVTNRPLFTLGLLQMFKAQTITPRELVLIDQSKGGQCIDVALEEDWWMPTGTHLQYIQVKPDASVGAMRNIGMEIAQGEYMTWMDDDGWHDPERVAIMLADLQDAKVDAIGIQGLYWSDLKGDFYHYRGTPNFPISGSMVWHRRCAEAHRFNVNRRRASDHGWISSIRDNPDLKLTTVNKPTICVGVSHGFNLSNPSPPGLARPVGNVSAQDFYPDEPYGLKAHLARINEAVKIMRETA